MAFTTSEAPPIFPKYSLKLGEANMIVLFTVALLLESTCEKVVLIEILIQYSGL